jgi:ABC-type transport system substrate-binding protein
VEDAPRYTYDPEKARQLLDEVLGAGEELDGVKIYGRIGDFPTLWSDTIMSYWSDVGVHATFELVEGDRQDEVDQPGVDAMPVDGYFQPGHGNELRDASITLGYVDGCNDQRSYSVCDPEFTSKLEEARAATGQERRQLLEELSLKYIVNDANMITLWRMPTLWGASEGLEWPNPPMGWFQPARISLPE